MMVAQAAALVAYWLVQGTLFWGIFTLGHDCGHASFSKYKGLNQFFGNLLHSFLLVCIRLSSCVELVLFIG